MLQLPHQLKIILNKAPALSVKSRLAVVALVFSLICQATIAPIALAKAPTDQRETEAKIKTLQDAISGVQRNIERKQSEKDVLTNQLREAEIEISTLDKSLTDIESAITAELSKLEQLDSKRRQLHEKVTEEQDIIAEEMRSLWALQQGGGARILFGDQSHDQLARNLAYYRYLLKARSESIEQFELLLNEVASNSKDIRASQQRFANKRRELDIQRKRINKLQEHRHITLTKIDKSLSSDIAKVAKLEADTKKLTALLEKLHRNREKFNTPLSHEAFTKAKGKMFFPTDGLPSNRYGATRNVGNLRWHGWMIPAREGSNVRAIHHGRVVYADWLPGQGLLIILDHGEDYLSLYGHNRSLQRRVGDWVQSGDIIANVGASGGYGSPGLYFEIRSRGQPINPNKWVIQ